MLGSPVDEIKNRLDIVEVIGQYIKLQKAGQNYRALCPFHSEKKPSFFVSPSRQMWHCFGCGAHGDIFGFVMKIEGIGFGDALRILARKAGVELKPMTPEYAALKTEKQRFYEICDLAARFFERQLEDSKTGKEVKQYLIGRGINRESIEQWRLGYAPESWQGLSDFLVGKGYKREEVEKTGLAIKNEEGNFYDRFRSRIIFPVFDLNSQVIGFGGRIFGEKEKTEVAKYVNTPNTLLYDKSRVVYGLDKAKIEIRKNDFCLLVEGYTDVILAHQAGFRNVVATSGTALTVPQLELLKRYSENLITCFDMDVAGVSATKRGIDLAQMSGFNIKIAVLPEGKDPADVLSRDPEKFEESIKNAKSILDYYFQNTLTCFNKEVPEEKKEISKILLPVIKRIPNKIVQASWLEKLSRELGVKTEYVEEELKKVSSKTDLPFLDTTEEPSETIGAGSEPKSRKDLLEERILVLIFKFPQDIEELGEDSFDYFSARTKEILFSLKKEPGQNPNAIFSNFKDSPEITNFLNYLLLKVDIEEEEEVNPQIEIQTCLKELKLIEVRDKLDEISSGIKKAEEEKDSGKVEQLIKKFNELSNKLISDEA